MTVGANALMEPYDVLENAALTMDEGGISEPIIGDEHIFILKLDRKELGGCQPFEEVQPLIEQQLQFEHRRKQYDTYINELIKQTDLVEMERFVEFCVNVAFERWRTQ